MVAPVIPVLAKQYDVSFGTASLVLVAAQAGALVFTFPAGYLMDRVGRRPVLLAGPLLAAVFSFMTPFAGSFTELLIYRFVAGGAVQLWQQARLAVITDTVAYDQRARQINWMMGMAQGGHLFGPSVGGFLAAGFGLWIPFALHAALSLLSVIPSFMLIKETAPGRRRLQPGEQQDAPDMGWRGLLAILLTGQMALFMAVQFCAALCRGGWDQGSLSLYAVYAYGLGPETLGVLNTVSALAGLPTPFITGWLMDRYSRKAVIIPSYALYGMSMVLAAMTAFLAAPLLPFALTYIFVQACLGTTSGTMQILGSDRAPAFARGRFFAVWRLVGQLASTVSPALFAVVAEVGSYGAAFLTLAAFSLVVPVLVAGPLRDNVAQAPSSARTAGKV